MELACLGASFSQEVRAQTTTHAILPGGALDDAYYIDIEVNHELATLEERAVFRSKSDFQDIQKLRLEDDKINQLLAMKENSDAWKEAERIIAPLRTQRKNYFAVYQILEKISLKKFTWEETCETRDSLPSSFRAYLESLWERQPKMQRVSHGGLHAAPFSSTVPDAQKAEIALNEVRQKVVELSEKINQNIPENIRAHMSRKAEIAEKIVPPRFWDADDLFEDSEKQLQIARFYKPAFRLRICEYKTNAQYDPFKVDYSDVAYETLSSKRWTLTKGVIRDGQGQIVETSPIRCKRMLEDPRWQSLSPETSSYFNSRMDLVAYKWVGKMALLYLLTRGVIRFGSIQSTKAFTALSNAGRLTSLVRTGAQVTATVSRLRAADGLLAYTLTGFLTLVEEGIYIGTGIVVGDPIEQAIAGARSSVRNYSDRNVRALSDVLQRKTFNGLHASFEKSQYRSVYLNGGVSVLDAAGAIRNDLTKMGGVRGGMISLRPHHIYLSEDARATYHRTVRDCSNHVELHYFPYIEKMAENADMGDESDVLPKIKLDFYAKELTCDESSFEDTSNAPKLSFTEPDQKKSLLRIRHILPTAASATLTLMDGTNYKKILDVWSIPVSGDAPQLLIMQEPLLRSRSDGDYVLKFESQVDCTRLVVQIAKGRIVSQLPLTCQ